MRTVHGWIHASKEPRCRDMFWVIWDSKSGLRTMLSVGSGAEGMSAALHWFEVSSGKCVQLKAHPYGFEVYSESEEKEQSS